MKYRHIAPLSTPLNKYQHIARDSATGQFVKIAHPPQRIDSPVQSQHATADVDSLRQSLAEAYASIGDLRQSLAMSGEFRAFLANDLEKAKQELKRVTGDLDVHKKVGQYSHSIATLAALSRSAVRAAEDEEGAEACGSRTR